MRRDLEHPEIGPVGADRASGLRALRDLRAARRRRYAEQVDWMESLYRLYLGVIFGGLGLALVSGALADVRVDRNAVQEIQRHGAAVLGLLVAIAVAGGLRSGGRGGPLVLEAADVQHVLLAPIDRGAALRRLAGWRVDCWLVDRRCRRRVGELAGLGGISLDAARRRAGLVAQLRFAVTTQDLRAIILLRRRLASELPRRRPWLRLASSAGSRGAVWTRDWRSFLRWPLVRVARVFVLGAVAGVSLLGAWRGTTPLVLVASLGVMVAAFDAVEPIGQEVDHPTRLALLPVGAREVIRRHLLAPEVLMAGVLLIAVCAVIAAGAPADLVGVLVVMALPTAVLSLYCAALGVTNDPFAYVLAPAIGYVQMNRPGVRGDFWPWKIKDGVHANRSHSWEADDQAVFA